MGRDVHDETGEWAGTGDAIGLQARDRRFEFLFGGRLPQPIGTFEHSLTTQQVQVPHAAVETSL